MTLELLMQNFTVCKVYSLPPELLAETSLPTKQSINKRASIAKDYMTA